MALEDNIPLALVFVSFIPAYIGSMLDQEVLFQRLFTWFLYAISLFGVIISFVFINGALQRAFGGTPSSLETDLLSIIDIFYIYHIIVMLVFGFFIFLGLLMLYLNFLRRRRMEKTP